MNKVINCEKNCHKRILMISGFSLNYSNIDHIPISHNGIQSTSIIDRTNHTKLSVVKEISSNHSNIGHSSIGGGL